MDTRGDTFAMTRSPRYRGRADAALALRDDLSTLPATPAAGTATTATVGEIGGFDASQPRTASSKTPAKPRPRRRTP